MEQGKTILQDNAACYAAFSAHDPRFDGRFFVGISSTGIYCRPVCRVKMPKEENCSYFASAAAAENAGYRPCLKCRPELAPGLAPADAPGRLARRAAWMMEEDSLCDSSVAELAERLAITERHLRRVFAAEYGVPPVQYLQTQRLLLAKSLLTDTTLPITSVAMAAGFGSIRRFNALFKKQYRMAPTSLRKLGGEERAAGQQGITLLLGYRPPYQWGQVLAFLAPRGIPGIESVEDGVYRRTVTMRQGGKDLRGWIVVENRESKNALAVTLSVNLLPVLAKVLARVRSMFDLNCNPDEVYGRLAGMNETLPGAFVVGTRLPGCFAPFEMAVRAVLGQQITEKAAKTLITRVAMAFGEPVQTPFEGLTHTFPTAEAMAGLPGPINEQLGPLGVIAARARCIYALACALVEGNIDFMNQANPEAEMKKMLALPGFGPWTVEYFAMRAFNWPDAFPHTDFVLKKMLGGMPPAEILQWAEQWRPWRAYAAVGLWNLA